MPRQNSTPEDIALPGIQGQRPVAGYDVSAWGRGGQALAQAGQTLGKDIEKSAQDIAEVNTYQHKQAVENGLMTLSNAYINNRNQFSLSNDPADLDNWQKANEDARTRFNGIVPQPNTALGAHAATKADLIGGEENFRITQRKHALATSQAEADTLKDIENLRNTTTIATINPDGAPDSTREMQMQGVHARIDARSAQGLITPEKAQVYKQHAATTYAESEIRAVIAAANAEPDPDKSQNYLKLAAHMMGRSVRGGGQPQGAGGGPSFSSPQVNDAISRASQATGLNEGTLRQFAKIESSGRPGPEADTGSYKGLFQLSKAEFNRYGGGDIYSPYDNAMAAANKLKAESAAFANQYGRNPTAADLYLIHNQGAGGYAAHMANPNAPAWQNMLATAEGREKGEKWARAAIWGNIPDQNKPGFGSVDNVTSRDFVNLWSQRFSGGGPNLPPGELPQGSGAQPATAEPGAASGAQQPDFSQMPPHPISGLVQTALAPQQMDALSRLIEVTRRAKEVDQLRAQAATEKARKDASEQLESKIFAVSRLDPQHPPLTPAEIISMGPAGSHEIDEATVEKLVNLYDRVTKASATEDHDVKTYGAGFHDAFLSVHAAPDDPKRITDAAQLYPRLGQDLTLSGIEKLRTEIAGKRTPEGEAEGEMKKQFLKDARGQITGTNDMFHIKDPKGDELYLKWLAEALPAYDKARAEGKGAAQLLNPDSPDYIGKSIPILARKLEERFGDVIHDAPAPAAAPGMFSRLHDAVFPPKFDPAAAKSLDELKAAVSAGTLKRDQAIEIATQRGWIRANPAATPPPPAPLQVPVSRPDAPPLDHGAHSEWRDGR